MYKIYISTFGQSVIKVDGGVPIEVGAANRNNFIYQLHDNAGENISTENEYYGELQVYIGYGKIQISKMTIS